MELLTVLDQRVESGAENCIKLECQIKISKILLFFSRGWPEQLCGTSSLHFFSVLCRFLHKGAFYFVARPNLRLLIAWYLVCTACQPG